MTREEKLAEYGEGPWLDEPDLVEYLDEATGYTHNDPEDEA